MYLIRIGNWHRADSVVVSAHFSVFEEFTVGLRSEIDSYIRHGDDAGRCFMCLQSYRGSGERLDSNMNEICARNSP